jgi:hypothetical protein
LSTELLKKAIPILKWGIFFLQIAASTQGLGAVVSPLSGLLDVVI